MSGQKNTHDQLVHELLNHSLVINEYKQQNKMIEVDEYIKLLNDYIQLAQSHRDYCGGMQDIFFEVDKIGGRK